MHLEHCQVAFETLLLQNSNKMVSLLWLINCNFFCWIYPITSLHVYDEKYFYTGSSKEFLYSVFIFVFSILEAIAAF